MRQADPMKTEQVHFRVTAEERRKLGRIAAARGTSASNLVREFIAREDERLTREATR